MAGVSGERMGAELRLLLAEPQPEALRGARPLRAGAAARASIADPARIAAALAAAPPDARRDLLALAAAWPPDDDRLQALGFTAADRRILAAAARAPGLRAALDRADAPSAVRRDPPPRAGRGRGPGRRGAGGALDRRMAPRPPGDHG